MGSYKTVENVLVEEDAKVLWLQTSTNQLCTDYQLDHVIIPLLERLESALGNLQNVQWRFGANFFILFSRRVILSRYVFRKLYLKTLIISSPADSLQASFSLSLW